MLFPLRNLAISDIHAGRGRRSQHLRGLDGGNGRDVGDVGRYRRFTGFFHFDFARIFGEVLRLTFQVDVKIPAVVFLSLFRYLK